MISPEIAMRQMRRFLGERYPSLVFDLTLMDKMGETSISVRWWNGPTELVVDQLLDHFRSIERTWSRDEAGRLQAQDFLEERLFVNPQGQLEERLYTPMQINCERLYTQEILLRAAAELAQELKIRPPSVIDTIAEVLNDNGINIEENPEEYEGSLGKYFDIDDDGETHEGIPLRTIILERLGRQHFAE